MKIMWEESISLIPPYDFHQALQRLKLDPLHNVDLHQNKAEIPIYKVNDTAAIQFKGDREQPSVQIMSSAQEKDTVIEELNRIFHWNESLLEVHQFFQNTNLHQLFERQFGTPLVGDFSVYSCLVRCIVHQQVNMKFAFTLTERFVHTYGYQKNGVWFYPKPETVAALRPEELRALQFSQRKAEYVIDLSRKIVDGEVEIDKLDKLTDEEIYEKLTKLRGIGPWTVQNVLLFGLGRKNVLPAKDIGVQNAIKQYFSLPNKPTLTEIEQLEKEWSPYKSYATFYLWRSIEPNGDRR